MPAEYKEFDYEDGLGCCRALGVCVVIYVVAGLLGLGIWVFHHHPQIFHHLI